MAKIFRIGRGLLREGVVPKLVITFATVLGVPSAILTILGAHWSIALTVGLVLLALLLSLFIHRAELSRMPMPSVIDLLLNGHTHLHCPCDEELASEASLIAENSYPPGAITPDRFEQLRLKNPQILACLTDSDGTLLGYFDVLPLKPHFAKLFLRGAITEEQITHEDIYAPYESRLAEYLFISGLAVRDPESQTGRVSASILVWALMQYIDKFYSSTEALVFAIASTRTGDQLLRRFRFGLRCGPDRRLDRFKLYALELSQYAIDRRLECVPDWSPTCNLPWLNTNRTGGDHGGSRVHRPVRRPHDLPSPLTTEPA